ncbi:hypothetical protein [Niallia circulans]|uniref:hypothetical protein n=1 Tax=Niallia circulans TaxID=1397 RepID=UPI0026ED17E1|nr:hypothetical protein [Niallia circulans]
MIKCIECNLEITGDFAECYDGSIICETCLWKEAEETFGRKNANEFSYNAVKLSYEGHKCLEVPVDAEEMCHFIDVAAEGMFRENFDYSPFEGYPDGGFLKVLEDEIIEANLNVTVREYLKVLIRESTEEQLDSYCWNTLVLSHNEIIQVGLKHKLPECIAI